MIASGASRSRRAPCVNGKAVDAFKVNFYGVLVGFCLTLVDFYGVLVGFCLTLVDFYGVLVGFCLTLVDFYGVLVDFDGVLVHFDGVLVGITLVNFRITQDQMGCYLNFLTSCPKEKANKNPRYLCGGKAFDLEKERSDVPHLGRPE